MKRETKFTLKLGGNLFVYISVVNDKAKVELGE